MKLPNPVNDTCVYIHTRLDGTVFYVGIGSPTRPYEEIGRNKHWQNTTSKYGYLTTILHKNLTWEQACAIEIELIKKYREISGDKLCNQTLGGEGTKGNTVWLGKTHSSVTIAKMRLVQQNRSPETLAKLSSAHKGKTASPETRAKIAEANRNRSPETREKLRIARNARPSASPETRVKMSEAQKGRVHSEETKAKISAAKKGNKNMLGKIPSEETRVKISVAKQNMSQETREKMSVSQQNRSPEHRAKLSAAAKNRSPEYRASVSASLKGRVFSDEHRAKLSAARRAYLTTRIHNEATALY